MFSINKKVEAGFEKIILKNELTNNYAVIIPSCGAILHEFSVQSRQEINGNHLRALATGIVTATAVPVHVGRTSHVWTVEIRDEAGRLVCVSRCTLAIVERRTANGERA